MKNGAEKQAGKDIYSRITGQIVATLESGTRPWIKPWNAEHAAGRITRPLRHNGQPYNGVNILSLWCDASLKGYTAPIWMTYKQATEMGANVRKGEHGSLVVYANSIMRKETDEKNGDETENQIHFLKGYIVFNVEQIEGLPEKYYATVPLTLDPVARIETAEKFFASTGSEIRHGGNRAYYATKADYIQMPPFEAFRDAESYYATLAHETTHWTSHATRLARDFGSKCFGSDAYAVEELVAELGSAFLCADLSLSVEPREDHAAYLESWLKVLKADNKAIFTAAAHAQRAADYINRLQPATVSEEAA